MSGRTQDPSSRISLFVYRAITLSRSASQLIQLKLIFVTLTLVLQPQFINKLVWALTLSLAATEVIIVIFFSCG